MEQKQIIVIAIVAVVALAAVGGGVALLAGKNSGGETEYTVTYNVNGGNAIDPFKFTKSTETFALATPTWDAEHTFLAWYDNQEFTGSPVTQIVKGTEKDVSVWAKWQLNKTSLPSAAEMSSNTAVNTTLGEGATVEQKTVPTDVVNAITAGKTLTVNNVDNTGKTTLAWIFNGAATQKEGYSGAAVNTNVVPNTSALASERKITLAFDYSGKLPYDSTIKYYVGTEYAGQEISVKNDADLNPIGSYTVDAAGYVTFTIDHCSDWVLTICYIVTFDPAGAEITSVPAGWEMLDNYYAKKFPCGTPMTVVEQEAAGFVCQKTGYTITAYNSNSATVRSDGTSRITVQWAPIVYHVAFDKNNQNATGTMATVDRTYDQHANLPAVAFSSENEAFLGWAITADGPVAYADGANVVNLTAVNDATVTLYAKWGANNVSVSIILDGVPDADEEVSIQKGEDQPIALTYVPSAGFYFSDNGIEKDVTYMILIGNMETGVTVTTTNGSGSHNFVNWSVSFVTSYGSAPTQIVGNGGKAVNPNIVRDGYQAAVWKNGNVAWNFASDTVTGTTVLTAEWTPNQYEITFATVGGTAVAPVLATYDANMPAITPSTKTGYTLQGFFYGEVKYYNADGTSAHVWDVASACELTAQWTANQYTISFNTQGGSEVASVTATYGEAMPSITSPVRTGYNFDGIFYNNTVKYYNADGTSARNWDIAGNTELTASWSGKQYTIAFNLNGGTGAIEDQVAVFGNPMPSVNAPTKAGYEFDGFYYNTVKYYNDDGTSARNWDIDATGTTELTARWAPIRYTVTIALSGGEAEHVGQGWEIDLNGNYTKRFENGTTVASILADFGTTPTKDYNTFASWSPDSGAVDAAPLTIAAQWTAKVYTIEFNTMGGTGSVSSVTKSYGDILAKPDYSGTKAGYTFGDNWLYSEYSRTPVFTGDSRTVDAALLLWAEDDDTLTLYAKWDAINYTVHFDVNTGTGTVPEDITDKKIGDSISLEAPDATKAERFFGGWNTKADGTGTNYLCGSNTIDASFVEFAAGTTVTLYANWTEGVYRAAVGDKMSFDVTTQYRGINVRGTIDEYVIWADSANYDIEYVASGDIAEDFEDVRYDSCVQGMYPYLCDMDAEIIEDIRTHGQATDGNVTITRDGSSVNVPVRIYTASIDDPDLGRATYVYKEDSNGTGYSVEITEGDVHGTIVLRTIETASYRQYTESTQYNVTYYDGIDSGSSRVVSSSHTYKTPQELGMAVPSGKVFVGWSWTNDADIVSDNLQIENALHKDMFLKARHAVSDSYMVYAVWDDYVPPATNISWVIYNRPAGLGIEIDGNDAISSNGAVGEYITFSGASNWTKEIDGEDIKYSFTVGGIQYYGRVQTVVTTIYGTFANVADDSDGNAMRIRFLNLGTHGEPDYNVLIVFWQEGLRLSGYVPTVGDSFTYSVSNGNSVSWSVSEIDPPARGESGEYTASDDLFYYYEYPNWYNRSIRYIVLEDEQDCVYSRSSYRFGGADVDCWHVTSTVFTHSNIGSVGCESTDLNTSAYYGVNDGLLYWNLINGYSSQNVALTSKNIAAAPAPCADVTYNGNGGVDYLGHDTVFEEDVYYADDYEYFQSFKRSGYTIIGWNTAADGTGRAYHARDTFNAADISEGFALTLYAMWEFSGAYIDITGEGADPSRLIQVPEGDKVMHYAADSGLVAPSGKAPAFYRFAPFGNADFMHVDVRVLPATGWTILPQSDGTYKIYRNGTSGYDVCQKMADRDVYYYYTDYTEYFGNEYEWMNYPTIFACIGTSVPLTVVWDSSPLTLTYHANDGSGTTVDRYVPSVDHALYRLEGSALFTRAGYELVGWCFSEEYDEEKTLPVGYFNSVANTVKDLMDEYGSHVYAVWKPYMTVTYNANGAEGSIDDGRFYYGVGNNTFSSRGNLTYEGKTFIGWGTSAGSAVAYYANDRYNMQESEIGTTLALYAIWADETYSIQFDKNAGPGMDVWGSMSNLRVGVGITSPLKVNAYYDDNSSYRFTGWNTAADGTGTSYADRASVLNLGTAGEEVTLYAQWSNDLVVNFSGGEGAVGSMDPIHTTYNSRFELPENGFTKSGYVFDAWQVGDYKFYPGDVAYYSSAAGPSVTIVSLWIRVWTVSFNVDGGSEVESQLVRDGYCADCPEEPTKVGYLFDGWFNAAVGGDEFAFGEEIHADTIVYAHWNPITYTVCFDANGGDGDYIEPIVATYGVQYTIPNCTYTNEGKAFSEWNTDSEGDGQSYAHGTRVSNLANEDGAEITLYAIWVDA